MPARSLLQVWSRLLGWARDAGGGVSSQQLAWPCRVEDGDPAVDLALSGWLAGGAKAAAECGGTLCLLGLGPTAYRWEKRHGLAYDRHVCGEL